MLVSLQQASDHLRRDTDDDDADLALKVLGASERVLGYIDAGIAKFKNADGTWISADAQGNWVAPYAVQSAVLLLVGYMYEQRDGDAKAEFDGGDLPRPVRALLRNLRRPVLA